MNRFMSILLCFFLSFVIFTVNSYAEVFNIWEEEDVIKTDGDVMYPGDIKLASSLQEAVEERNVAIKDQLLSVGKSEQLIDLNFQFTLDEVSEDIYNQYGIIVRGTYNSDGSPLISNTDVSAIQDRDPDGDWRIIGQNVNEEWVENPFYDPTPNSDLDKRDWIYNDDKTHIWESAIGPMVSDNALYDHEGIIHDYYVNFLYGFEADYGEYLSQSYSDDLGVALVDYFDAYRASEFTMSNWKDGYHYYYNVGTPGSTNPPLGASNYGSYMKIISLPSDHSAGVAYLFHERNGTVYYLSVWMHPDNTIEDILFQLNVEAEIDAPTIVDSAVNTVDATFDFTINSDSEITNYELFDVSSGVTIKEAMIGTVGGGLTTYSHSVPITIDTSATSQHVYISVRATNIDGETAEATDDHTITKTVRVSGGSGAMDAGGTGVLMADDRGSEDFDVLQGIPTTEELYANIITNSYLYNEDYTAVSGTVSYSVTVSRTYTLRWQEYNSFYDRWDAKSATDTVTRTYNIHKDYLYHIISNLEVFGLTGATVVSDVLDGDSLWLPATGYTAPTASATEHSDHMRESVSSRVLSLSLPGRTLDGGRSGRPSVPSEDWQSQAEAATGTLEVRNDQVTFNGSVIMNDGWQEQYADVPGSIPVAPAIGNNVLYENNLAIPEKQANGTFPTTATITYDRILSVNTSYPDTVNQAARGINDVTIHSPVVCYPDIPMDLTYNQVVDRDDTRANVVIDQNFSVDFPNDGQHENFPGYGNRDYEAYIGYKQINPGCDLYLMDGDSKYAYVEKGEWYTLAPSQDSFQFRVPHWVEEQDTEILFRTFANNTPGSYAGLYEFNRNSSNTNYYAVESIDIAVVGQIFDFRIIGTTDGNFDSFFADGATDLYSGTNDRYGEADSSHSNLIPIMPGTNTEGGYQNMAVKKGHSVFFQVSTNGNMKDRNDYVLAIPSFYHVDSVGNRQAVDLWYENGGTLKQLSSNPQSLTMALNNPYSAINSLTLENTAWANSQMFGMGSFTDYNAYLIDYENNVTKEGQGIGNSVAATLDWAQKVYEGSRAVPSGISDLDALTGVQTFYGMYTIPAKAIAVPQGTATDQVPTSGLTGGYIVVNFDLETIDNFSGDPNAIHLSYDGAACDMFAMEGYDTSQFGYSLYPGDVIFYYDDKSASMDYTNMGTH